MCRRKGRKTNTGYESVLRAEISCVCEKKSFTFVDLAPVHRAALQGIVGVWGDEG